MEYTTHKVDGQQFMYRITTTHGGKEIAFNVVCASSEDEIPELVAQYLDYLDNPPPPPQPGA